MLNVVSKRYAYHKIAEAKAGCRSLGDAMLPVTGARQTYRPTSTACAP